MPPPFDYYDDHVDEFVLDTLTVEMAGLYEPFLQHLPAGGQILDAGCGSGRDTRYFVVRGYKTVAIDASVQMVEAARVFTGHPILHMRFQQIEWADEFDGVWACASLLHVPRTEMDDVFRRLIRALKPGGVWFTSFKHGTGEGVRNGRFYNDYEEDGLRALIDNHKRLMLLRLWTTHDLRKGREEERWTNAVVRRQS